MKIKLLLLFLILSLAGHLALRAAKVEMDDARRAALNVYSIKALALNPAFKSEVSILSEYSVKSNAVDVYYVFNMKAGGWIVMSADDRVFPVLAFSTECAVDPEKGSPEFRWWMDSYKKQIEYAVNHNLTATAEINKEWQQCLSGNIPPAPKGAKIILPLLTSTWDQGLYYNMLCPEDPAGPGGHVWTGCVATSLAQVMYYYRYPLHGTGSHGYNSNYGYLSADFGATTYQWQGMEDNISNLYNIPMAELQYHLGVAVEMNYSPNGSGASMWTAVQALIDYFGYSSSLQLQNKNDDSLWIASLKAQLDLKEPICYAGYGNDGGHAFVCDGYEGTGHFHFNWGWSGYDDGYFYLSNLNPSYNFTNGQQAIFGMVPAANFPYGCSGTDTITGGRGTIEDGSGPLTNYASNGDCRWLIEPDIPVASIKLNFSKFDTEPGNDVVTVYNGAATSDSVLGVFSGSNLPLEVQSTGSKMLVRFTTNGSSEASGWTASFASSYPQYCSQLTELITPSGAFSDGSGSSPYNNSTLCRWRIDPPGATGISIYFSSFDLAGNDLVRIYDEVGNSTIATFYGNTLPGPVFVATSKVLVVFMTDGNSTAGGFDATYTSGNNGISGDSPLKGLCVYPNPVKNMLHVTSGIKTQEIVALHIYNPEGKEIIQRTVTPAKDSIDESIDMSAFSQGVYFLVLETASSRQAILVTKE